MMKKVICRLFSVSMLALMVGCFKDTPMSTIHTVTQAGRDINYVYFLTTVITVVIFFAVAIPVVIALVRFREKEDDDGSIPPQIHGNPVLEFIWTVVPVILLIIIAVPTWQIIFKQAREPAPDALKVEVIGHQWWWEFRYPDLGIVTANEIHLPENTEIDLDITSADILHSFWVPKFGGKVDSVPGHNNPLLWDTPAAIEEGGDYYQGQCAELCGLSHALMRFQAVVHKKDEWDRWVQTYDNPPNKDTSFEHKGDEIFHTYCMSCHAISGTASAEIPGPRIGPDLSNFGNRKKMAAGILDNNQANLRKWIKNSGSIKPGSLMTSFEEILSDKEIDAVISYIRNSTVKDY